MKDYLRIRMFRLFIYPFRIISIRNGVRAAFTVGMIFPPEVGKDEGSETSVPNVENGRRGRKSANYDE